jgi:hypothetical protein
MIFPNLRSPLERAAPTTNVKRLAHWAYLRILQVRYPDQKTDPSYTKSQDDTEGQAQRSASPAAP